MFSNCKRHLAVQPRWGRPCSQVQHQKRKLRFVLTGTFSCWFFNDFHPMIWQKFKAEWGPCSWELPSLSQLTPTELARRAQMCCTECAPGCIYDPDAQHCSGDDKISPVSLPALCSFALLLRLCFPSSRFHHTPCEDKWEKTSAGWVAWQLVGPMIACHWHTAPALCVKENKLTGDSREMISKHETPTPPKIGSCTMHTVCILPAWVHAACTWRAEDWFAVQY